MKISNRRQCSGHLEIILAVIIALMGIVWYFQTAKKQPALAYYPQQQPYAAVQTPQTLPTAPSYTDKTNKTLLLVAGGLIYIIGLMSGLILPLIHSIRQKHHKVPFSLTHFLPTKGNRAMHFLDCLQQMRDTGLISKQEYESKRLEFLSKL